MLRTGLFALLLLGLGSTAMASDRVRVFVGVDDYGSVRYGFSYVDRGRDHGRWDGYRHDRRWHDHYRDGRRGHWRDERYYSAPRGYYYPKSYRGPWKGYRHGYSRGWHGDRHWHGHRHDRRH